jgi:hypothetical protein
MILFPLPVASSLFYFFHGHAEDEDILVDHFVDAVDQFNDLLGHVVAGCGLRRRENDARVHVLKSASVG